jgi:Na+-translocating ferredoxin:NAD+ oxidoreductase RnfG subunit
VRQALIPFAIVALSASSCAFAADYLTVDQARQVLFPSAIQFEERVSALNPSQLEAVAQTGKVSARTTTWRYWAALDKSGNLLGHVVVDNVIGKFELITYAVGVSDQGVVQGVEILSYRENHGGEIRLASWRKQFQGKTVGQPIKIAQDIAGISGATLSCNHVTDGVRRIVAVLSVLSSAPKS